MKKKMNEWMKLVCALLSLCLVLSASLPSLAYAVETDTPDTSAPSGSTGEPVTPPAPSTSATQGGVTPPEPSVPTSTPSAPTEGPAPSEPVIPGVDNPPVLQHTPIRTVPFGEDVPFVITATDELGIYAQLFYRAIGATEWISKDMPADEGNSDGFSCVVAASEISENGMEYYIEVSDGKNIVSAGNAEFPIRFHYVVEFSINAVSPNKVDIAQAPNGITAFLTGKGFLKEGMTLTVGGTSVDFTYVSDTVLQFTLPALGVGAADVVLTYQNTVVTLSKGINYSDPSSLLILNYTTETDSGTQVKIPVMASVAGKLTNMELQLKMDPANWENISFTVDGDNASAQTECVVDEDGTVTVRVSSEAGISINQPVGYIMATAKTASGNVTSKVDVLDVSFNGSPAAMSFGCNVSILDKTPPVITVAPFDTTPTSKPVTVEVSTNEGTLNVNSYTFNENGSFVFEATDAAGNRSQVTVTVSHIYKSFTLELLHIPENLVIIEGMELDTTGWELKVVYDCGVAPATVPVTKEMLAPPVTAPGPAVGLIIYNSISAEFTYQILARADAELTVTKLPDKILYLPGEPLDLTGMELTLSCGDAYLEIIPAEKYTVTGYDAAVYGSQMLTVSYGSFTTTFPVSVKSPIPEGITSSVYSIKDGFISGVICGTTMDVLLENIPENEFIRVMDGDTEVSVDELLSTGMLVQLVDGETVVQSLTLIVTGDINGDGKITITDMVTMKAHILGSNVLEGAQALAADYNGDGKISITDFVSVKAYILNDGKDE